ncbi:MAG: RAMP superfamily CRISPR-associated protein [Nitrososphaerales archaeon]
MSFIRLKGTITTKTPLHIGEGIKSNSIKRTRNYIPGSVIRGAVGISLIKAMCIKTKYVDNHDVCPAKEGCPYYQLFEEKKSTTMIFRNAYPRHDGCANKGTYLPAPLTLHYCENCNERFYSYYTPLNCSYCEKPLEPYNGYLCSDCEHITKRPVGVMRFIIKDQKQSSDENITKFSMPDNIEVIKPNVQYKLDILMNLKFEKYIDLIHNTLEVISEEGIGWGKRQGFGKFRVKIEKIEPILIDELYDNAKRITTKDFVVRLISNAFLKGSMIKPETMLAYASRAYSVMYHKSKPSLPELTQAEYKIGYSTFGGWSLKKGKKRTFPSLKAGSMFRFKCGKEHIELARALAALEAYAIGGFKTYGLGQTLIERA